MISLIGIGSKREHITLKAVDRIKEADVVIAYHPYLTHIQDLLEGKEVHSRGMRVLYFDSYEIKKGLMK